MSQLVRMLVCENSQFRVIELLDFYIIFFFLPNAVLMCIYTPSSSFAIKDDQISLSVQNQNPSHI